MSKLQKWLMAGACAGAALAAAGGAGAADLYGRDHIPSIKDAPPPILVPLAYNWSGFYFGAHVGGAWGDVDWKLKDSPFELLDEGSKFSQDIDGFIGGGHLGLQHQFGRWVIGGELSLSGGDVDGSSRFCDPPECDGDIVKLKTEMDWLFLATARLGYAFDNWLLYVRGGYASADIDIRGREEAMFTTTFSSSERHDGYIIGAGLEYALTQGVILGVEYNFIDLGSETHKGLAKVDGVPDEEFKINTDPEIHTVTARLSFKIGREAPVAVAPPLK
jgi:outer membrane immunogenic protein